MHFFDRSLPRYPLSSVDDYRQMAKGRLPRWLFDFLEGGAFDEVVIGKNKADFQAIQLRRKVLQGVSEGNMSVEILGQKMSMPLLLAPVGFAGVYASRGEVQAAKAAAMAGIPFTLSTASICSIEEVAQQTSSPFWFQFSLLKDKVYSLDLLQRAEAARCPVLVFTVDLPMVGARYRYDRQRRRSSLRHHLDSFFHPSWWLDIHVRGRPLTLGNYPSNAPPLSDIASMLQWMRSQGTPGCWSDLEWLRSRWQGKIVVKGILDPEDALTCLHAGADGIVVSNHGGRHLDGTLSSIAALPVICEAVEGRMPVLIDGGITSGLDIVKALAVGADGCMIGKPWMYGLAARGQQGVSDILTIFKRELQIAMAHFGLPSIKAINEKALLLCE